MLVVVRTVDRLSVAKETPVLQAVKRMDWLWQQCSVLHFTHCRNGSGWNRFKDMAWRETDEAPFKKYRNPKNATGYHTDAKCCHASAKRLDYAGLRFSLHHGRLKQPLRVQWITPLPTICCHKLPPNSKAIIPCEQRIYFAGRKKNKQ